MNAGYELDKAVANVHAAICRNCEHVQPVYEKSYCTAGRNGPRMEYAQVVDYRCSHHRTQSPVTGEWGWPRCEDVNDGNCPHFVVAKS